MLPKLFLLLINQQYLEHGDNFFLNIIIFT